MTTSDRGDLYKHLRTLYEQQKSGRISVLYQFNGSSKACTILVHEGQIINIRPMLDLNRFHSANMQIKRVLLTASGNSGSREISPNTPKMVDFLRSFQAHAETRRGASAANVNQLADAMRLQNQVNEVFAQLIGQGSVAQISRIAARIPPANQPVQFLDECKGLIETTLNQAIADEIFKPMYENVRLSK